MDMGETSGCVLRATSIARVEKGTTKRPSIEMACHIPGSPGDVVFTHQHVELLIEGG
jgi:hypothetical protein